MVQPGGGSSFGDSGEIRLESACYVEVLAGPEVGRRYPLPLPRASIGRATANAVCIVDPSISSHHAEIVEIAGEVLLRDLGSRNGTLLEGEAIVEEPLRSGDTIQIGRIRLRFVDPAGGGEAGSGAQGIAAGGAGGELPAAAEASGEEVILRVRDTQVPPRGGGLATLLLVLLALAGSTAVFFWVRRLAPVVADTTVASESNLLAGGAGSLDPGASRNLWKPTPGLDVVSRGAGVEAVALRLDGPAVGTARLAVAVPIPAGGGLRIAADLTLDSGALVGVRLIWALSEAELVQPVFTLSKPGTKVSGHGMVLPPPGALEVRVEVALAGKEAAATVGGLRVERAAAAAAATSVTTQAAGAAAASGATSLAAAFSSGGRFTPFIGAGRASWLRRRGAWFLDLAPVPLPQGSLDLILDAAGGNPIAGHGGKGFARLPGEVWEGVVFEDDTREEGRHLGWILPGGAFGAGAGLHVVIPRDRMERTFLHAGADVVSLAQSASPGDGGGKILRHDVVAITAGTGLGRVKIAFDAPALVSITPGESSVSLTWVPEARHLDTTSPSSLPGGPPESEAEAAAPGGADAMGVTLVTRHDAEKAAALKRLIAARRKGEEGHPGEAFRVADAIARSVPFDPGLRAEARRVADGAGATCRSRFAPVEKHAYTALLLGHTGLLDASLHAVEDLAPLLEGSPVAASRRDLEEKLHEALRQARMIDEHARTARLDRLRKAARGAGWPAVARWVDTIRSRGAGEAGRGSGAAPDSSGSGVAPPGEADAGGGS